MERGDLRKGIYDILERPQFMADSYREALNIVKAHYGCTDEEAADFIEEMPVTHRCFICREIIQIPDYSEEGLVCTDCANTRPKVNYHYFDRVYVAEVRYHGSLFHSGEW
jgi:hypothetical protein